MKPTVSANASARSSARTTPDSSPWCWSTTRAPTAPPMSRVARRRPVMPWIGSPSCPGRRCPSGGPASCGPCGRASPRPWRRRPRRIICCSPMPTSSMRRRCWAGWWRTPARTSSCWRRSWSSLRCDSLPERGLIPAFIFFFQMLYPFAWVNSAGRPRRPLPQGDACWCGPTHCNRRAASRRFAAH